MELGKNTIREAGNRGRFYPHLCLDVTAQIESYNRNLDKLSNPALLTVTPKAVIVPHAGYVYSGFTANAAHKVVANAHPECVVVIGPSHYVPFEGMSLSFTKSFETPCGSIDADGAMFKRLNNSFGFQYIKKAHYLEHSTETQFPFIRHYNPDAKLLEIIYGKVDWQEVAALIEFLIQNQCMVVVSSDLSHFYPLKEAVTSDDICLKAIEKRDVGMLNKGCEACGIVGIKALLYVAQKQQLKSGILDYRTSAETSGNESSVVGYVSAVVW